MPQSFSRLSSPLPSRRAWSPPQGRGRLQLLQPVRLSAEAVVGDRPLCVSDLRQGAVHLTANELHHDPEAARRRPASWYQDAWNVPGEPELCSEAEAGLLREMTIEECEQAKILTDYTREGRRMSRASENLDGVSWVAVMIWLFLIVGLLAVKR